jgi:hypothetical protein
MVHVHPFTSTNQSTLLDVLSCSSFNPFRLVYILVIFISSHILEDATLPPQYLTYGQLVRKFDPLEFEWQPSALTTHQPRHRSKLWIPAITVLSHKPRGPITFKFESAILRGTMMASAHVVLVCQAPHTGGSSGGTVLYRKMQKSRSQTSALEVPSPERPDSPRTRVGLSNWSVTGTPNRNGELR